MTTDTSLSRYYALMQDYMKSVVFIDTSDYVQDYPEALNTNLMTASYSGFCTEIARFYVKGADINCMSYEDATPLHFAVEAGKLNAAEILLLLGASTERQDIFGKFPLLVAAETNNIEMADLLIRYGANIDTCDFSGVTSLHTAASNGNFYMTDMLIFHNARLDVKDKEGNTPLMISVWRGYYDITDLLLQSGANPDITDKKGFTPLMMAAQNGDTLMMSLLIKAGANLYSINSYGYDALCIAIRNGQTDAVNYLLKAGQQWFVPKNGKVNPKTVAVKYGNKNMDLSKYAIKKHLYFDQITFSAGGITTNHLSLLRGEVSVREPELKAGIFAAYSFYPVSSRVLVEKPDAIYQYRVMTSLIEAGVYKEFPFSDDPTTGTWSVVTSLSGAYRFFSEYNGTNFRPENKFCIIPSAGIQWNLRKLSITSDISYMNTPFYKMSPLWIDLKFSINFFSGKSVSPGKKIKIYRDEQ